MNDEGCTPLRKYLLSMKVKAGLITDSLQVSKIDQNLMISVYEEIY